MFFCAKLFKTKENLRDHKEKMHRKPECECSKCGQKFSTNYILQRHTEAVHEKISNYSCAICAKLYSRKDVLKKHYSQCKEKRRKSQSDKNETELNENFVIL